MVEFITLGDMFVVGGIGVLVGAGLSALLSILGYSIYKATKLFEL